MCLPTYRSWKGCAGGAEVQTWLTKLRNLRTRAILESTFQGMPGTLGNAQDSSSRSKLSRVIAWKEKHRLIYHHLHPLAEESRMTSVRRKLKDILNFNYYQRKCHQAAVQHVNGPQADKGHPGSRFQISFARSARMQKDSKREYVHMIGAVFFYHAPAQGEKSVMRAVIFGMDPLLLLPR